MKNHLRRLEKKRRNEKIKNALLVGFILSCATFLSICVGAGAGLAMAGGV